CGHLFIHKFEAGIGPGSKVAGGRSPASIFDGTGSRNSIQLISFISRVDCPGGGEAINARATGRNCEEGSGRIAAL
ncbi:MAG: hypothetical protein ABI823_04175, partial [Bryobacteraceae bacterium]